MSAAGAHARRDGLLLAASAVLGMVLMNSVLAPAFVRLLEAPISLGLAPVVLTKTAHHWVNDGLMALFFLLVGIEIRYEWQHGTLSTMRARVLPLGAALGGMLVPALVFTLFNHGQPQAMAGWAIPAATDIAFALGLMAIAAPRTAPALLAFLTAVAVLDDLGAIVVIAVFYTAQLSPTMLLGAAL
ncbi:MAG: Na+/H+ antiporter NhaA, partial [Betaproteobacteria bacterium]|nr:Na+/H+ antiporter NhaA [Betaproteobacteria bacterium]